MWATPRMRGRLGSSAERTLTKSIVKKHDRKKNDARRFMDLSLPTLRSLSCPTSPQPPRGLPRSRRLLKGGDHAGDGVVEGGVAVQVGLPEPGEELEIGVPAPLIEAFADGVRRVAFVVEIMG